MRVLITGITGFVGPYLADHIAEAAPEAEVCGLVWPGDSAPPPPGVRTVAGDLTDRSSLETALGEAAPDLIFHLAAASSVETSWQHPDQAFEINVVGTVNLFQALQTCNLNPKTVVISSAEVYGRIEGDEQPIREETPLQPVSPYGGSKAAQDLAAYQYFEHCGLPTVRLRSFHHTGPGRPANFVASSFAQQIAKIEAGLIEPRLFVGNLEAIRDFSDVRDVVRAYWLAALHAEPGKAYNICSGNGNIVRRLLEILLDQSSAEVKVEVDPDRLRPADIPFLVGNHDRFVEATGWRPEIPLEKTLGDLLDWWRTRS